jgi:hypothetical protein
MNNYNGQSTTNHPQPLTNNKTMTQLSKILKFSLLFALFAAFSTSEAQTWQRGQQVLIWPRPDSIAIGDTVIFNGYARTSAGAPVTNPLLRWNIVFDSTATALFTGNSVGLISQSTNRQATIHIRWQTLSGLFRDSIRVRFIERPAPLPWRPGQQALLMVTDTVARAGDTVLFRAYARTSSGVIVSAPQFTYSFTDYSLIKSVFMEGNTGQLVFRDTLRSNPNWFAISWTTNSGIFKDSVKIVTIP